MTKQPNKKAAGAPQRNPPVEGGGAPVAVLRVTAKAEGFRRAGRAWSKTPIELFADELTADELAQLEAEPMLEVERLARQK